MTLSPVIVFAYNRPLHLQRTLDALAACRLAGATAVHVYADGARKPAAAEAVAEVRRVLVAEAAAGRFASFDVHASDVNLGLANSIIRGVGQVLETDGRVIVLEDDLLVSADFLEFMNDCLSFYADDATIGSIAGSCPIRSVPTADGGVFAVSRNSSHGWGTWLRVWKDVDWSARYARELNASLERRMAFNREGNDRYDRLRRQLAGRIDSWSIRFGLSLFQRGLATVYPVTNRVSNIGYDDSGVHCRSGEAMNAEIGESPYVLGRLAVQAENQAAFHRAFSGAWRGRWGRNVLCVWPRLAGWLGR
ncbi:hypothetical protein [Thermomonas sp.]|uniref:hypothetical protein n=1 Tax=Thermomonas sp. TaxID=1971895 RepID=UPI0035B0CA78